MSRRYGRRVLGRRDAGAHFRLGSEMGVLEVFLGINSGIGQLIEHTSKFKHSKSIHHVQVSGKCTRVSRMYFFFTPKPKLNEWMYYTLQSLFVLVALAVCVFATEEKHDQETAEQYFLRYGFYPSW